MGRAVRLFPIALLMLVVGVGIGLLADPASAAPDTPATPEVPERATTPAAPTTPTQSVPPGCPGGPDEQPIPGTECPDGSVPGLPPPGCPGGPQEQPIPGTRCPDGSVPADPLDPAGCRFGLPDEPETGTICPDGSAPRDREADARVRNILGIDSGIEHEIEAYDIGCDEGSWNAFLRKMWCGFQSWPFALGKWFIGTGTNLMEWALEFRIARVLTPLATGLSDVYESSFVGPLAIEHLAWTLTLLVGGWNIMQARFGNGFREILTTFVIAIFGSMLLSNPSGYLQGSVRLADNLSGASLEAVDGAMNSDDQSTSADAVRARITTVFTRSFVAEPYDLINWGGPLTGECAAARDRILEGGPWGSDDRPRDVMREAGCDEAADFNAKPTDERAAASLTVAGATIVVTILMLLITLAVFAAQVTLIALFAGASVIWAVALFPGNRAILWWWLSRLVWSVLITFASVFMLSWASITATAVLDATTDLSIVQRCLIVLVVVAVAYRFRSALDRGIEGAAQNLNRSMRGSTTQGPGPAAGAGFAAFGAGAALVGAGVARSAPRAARAAPAAVAAARGPLSLNPRQLTTAAIAGAGTASAMGRRGGRVVVTGAQQVRTAGGTAARGSQALGAATIGRRAMAPPIPVSGGNGGGSGATAASEGVRGRIRQARDTQRRWMKTARNPRAEVRRSRDAAERIRQETHEWM